MRWIYVLTLVAMLAQSYAALSLLSDGDYSVDSPLFSSDDLSSFHFFTDDDSVPDDSVLGDLSTIDDNTAIFAGNIDDCSSDNAFQPGRKIRARQDSSCPSGSGSSNPAIRLPDVNDVEQTVKPDTKPEIFKPQELWHKGLGYYPICPTRNKKPADWVVCGIQGLSLGPATWEYDVYDADLCMY